MSDQVAETGGKPVKKAMQSKIGLIALAAWMLGAFKTIVEYLKSAIENEDLISDMLFYIGDATMASIIIWYAIAIPVFPLIDLLSPNRTLGDAINQKAMPFVLTTWALATAATSFYTLFFQAHSHGLHNPLDLLGSVRILVQAVGVIVTAILLIIAYTYIVPKQTDEHG